jgi:chromosome segregation ATPase
MPRNPELDALRAKVQSAFEAKQAKYSELEEARRLANVAFGEMKSARAAHDEAFGEMKRLRDELNESSRNHDLVWSEYSRLKESLSSRIDDLKAEADDEHRMMSECFDQASHEYNYGDRALASSYSQDGHKHKANRDALNAEVSELCRQLKSAREDAQWRAPRTDSSEYQAAKARFEQAKALLDEAKRAFDAACDRRDLLQAAFSSLNDKHKTLKAEFERKLAEVKALRESDPILASYPSSGNWSELRHGWIDDHPVSWREGIGPNAGQTLICDGHVDSDYFDKHHRHDHYGPNVKYKSGGRIEDITDALGRKKYYSGPG